MGASSLCDHRRHTAAAATANHNNNKVSLCGYWDDVRLGDLHRTETHVICSFMNADEGFTALRARHEAHMETRDITYPC